MGKWLWRFRAPKEPPHAILMPGIYFRDLDNRIYYLPNTWEAGAIIEFVGQAQGLVRGGFQRTHDVLPPQKLQTLEGTIVEVGLMTLKEWWVQKFVGEFSSDPPLPSPGPQAPGAGRVQPFPIAER